MRRRRAERRRLRSGRARGVTRRAPPVQRRGGRRPVGRAAAVRACGSASRSRGRARVPRRLAAAPGGRSNGARAGCRAALDRADRLVLAISYPRASRRSSWRGSVCATSSPARVASRSRSSAADTTRASACAAGCARGLRGGARSHPDARNESFAPHAACLSRRYIGEVGRGARAHQARHEIEEFFNSRSGRACRLVPELPYPFCTRPEPQPRLPPPTSRRP